MSWGAHCYQNSIQGGRSYQEDKLSIHGVGKRLVVTVCDGHGGARCSEWVHKQFTSILHAHWPKDMRDMRNATLTVAMQWDQMCMKKLGIARWPKTPEEREHMFATPAAQAYEDGEWSAGTTIIAAAIDLETGEVLVTNVGDSRAVWWNGVRSNLHETEDHKPERADLGALGGFVRKGRRKDSARRINGDLAVGRAIGDNSDTLMGSVICTPHVYSFHLSRRGDTTIVLGTDGVFDVIKSNELPGIVQKAEKAGENPAKLIVAESDKRDSGDNISAAVIKFHRKTKPTEAPQAKNIAPMPQSSVPPKVWRYVPQAVSQVSPRPVANGGAESSVKRRR